MADPILDYVISQHAALEMRRGLDEAIVRRVPAAPEQDVLEEAAMKVTYDHRTDTLTVTLKEGVPVAESDEDKPGVILDYDDGGNLLSLEILDASRHVTDARKVEYQTTE
jgi:uncharacterized protein YuzE